MFSQPQREGRRDPQAEAIEAIQKLSPKPIAGPAAKSHQNLPGAVLAVEQMRDPPDSQDPENQPVKANGRQISMPMSTGIAL